MKKIVVAVDGPAGSGKSTVSKKTAVRMNLKYIDSGAIYRSITWFFLNKYGNLSSGMDFENDFGWIDIRQDFTMNGESKTYLNGTEVTALIRAENIVANIGIISDQIKIRNFVNSLLRAWTEKDSIIMDGRDIGSVVFPTADLKIYLDASVDIRAVRRVGEYKEMGKNLDEMSIKNQIMLRDKQDMSRPFGALVKCEDAVFIDTSQMSAEEVIDKMCGLISEKLQFS
jgi:cytidylate kinase